MEATARLMMRAGCGYLMVGYILAGCPAWAEDQQNFDEISRGRRLATVVCAICHVAAADQPYEPVLRPPAPSFESIAQRKDINAETLEKFLNTTHRGLDEPKGMPNPDLLPSQIKEVSAYLLSLRKR